MLIYVLLIGLIIQFIYCYYVFDRDIFSPSAILCESFILSTLACIYNIDNWGVDLQPATLAVILGGNTVFIAVSSFIHLFFKKRKRINIQTEKLEYIKIQKIVLIIITVLYLAFSVIFVIMSMSVIKQYDQSGDMSAAMGMYRREMIEDGGGLPAWLTKIGVVFNLGTFILIYIFINNLLVNHKNKSNYLSLICVISYLFASVFTAQRTTILLMFIYILFITYYLLNRKYRFLKRINGKYLKRGVIAVSLFLLLFGITRGMFGRNDERTAIDNVTYYMGNSIESLDLYIKNPLESRQFGEELFRQFRVSLSQTGLVEETTMASPHLEFRRDAKGNSAGNVYTGYRYYIHDFGYGSILFFQIALALFFGIWYERLNRRKLKPRIDLSFVLYAWFVLVLFRFSIMNSFFSSLAFYIFSHWYVFLFWKIVLNFKFTTEYTNNTIVKKDLTKLEANNE